MSAADIKIYISTIEIDLRTQLGDFYAANLSRLCVAASIAQRRLARADTQLCRLQSGE